MLILAIDDHSLFVDGLRFLLEQQLEAVSVEHVTDAEQAIDWLGKSPEPDLILLDLNLPGPGGHSVLRWLADQGIFAPVLVVSASQSIHDARESLKYGALGFASKASDGSELIHAIRTVIDGDVYLPKKWQNLLDEGEELDNTHLDEANKMGITARQLEVLHLLAQGDANKMIAYRLGMSENTVKVHLREVFKALRSL